MNRNYKEELFYLCSLIEFIGRKTNNRRGDIVARLSDQALAHQLRAAEVNHCLSFEQVCDEWIEDYGIENGQFDNVSSCKYKVPTVMDIGRVYQTLIMDVEKSYKNIIEAIKAVYFSFISNEISDFNSSVYYSNPDYLRCSYDAGKLLD